MQSILRSSQSAGVIVRLELQGVVTRGTLLELLRSKIGMVHLRPGEQVRPDMALRWNIIYTVHMFDEHRSIHPRSTPHSFVLRRCAVEAGAQRSVSWEPRTNIRHPVLVGAS